ncbi:hypothetical protein FRC07_003738 [Ceratobasidium sp. 392]|nr:hypothetical protein FRC07_003738 [Ceratobasidium sp. 392]
MDPAYYSYTQGSSSHPTQYQNYGGNNQQLVANNPTVVSEYLRALYENPSPRTVAPSHDPAFFAKARQGIIEARHKTEQMMLALRQQEEMATLINTGAYNTSHTQGPSTSNAAYPQAYPQITNNPAAYQNAGWGDVMPNQWSYVQQESVPQEQRIRSAHISPEVEMVDALSTQRYSQVVQGGATSQPTTSYQPQPHVQPRPHIQPQARIQPQQRVQPQQQQQVQEMYVPPAEPQQAVPISQTWYPIQTTQLYHPQPQYRPKRHPLQPDEQLPQAGSSQPKQAQREREQVATTQKQLQYLHSLEQQHQRPQQESWPTAASQQQKPARPQPTSVPPPATLAASSTTLASQATAQTAQPNPPVPKPIVLPVTQAVQQPASLPASESSAVTATKEALAAPTQTKSPSPSKFPRSTARLTLQDLRTVRRRSSQAPVGQPKHQPIIVDESQDGPEQEAHGDPSQTMSTNENGATVVPSDTRLTNDNPHLISSVPNLSVGPPKHGDQITSSNTSNTPTVTARPPPPVSTQLAGPALGTPATPALAAVPPQGLSAPGFKPVTVPSTNASVPALNSGSSSGVPAQPTSSGIAQKSMAARGPTGAPSTNTGGSAPLKTLLERLHQRGVDCVEIVRRAAEGVGAPTDLLRLPSAGIGGTGQPVPLFASGQPLQLWAQNLKVNRVQGDRIVREVWTIAKNKLRELNLDTTTSQPIIQTGEANQQNGERFSISTGSAPGTSIHAAVPLASPNTFSAEHGTNLAPQTTYPTQSHPLAPQGAANVPVQISIPTGTPVYGYPAAPPMQQPATSAPPPPQATFNVPVVQSHGQQASLGASGAALAQHHHLGPQPVVQRPQGLPNQHSYQSHPIYQRPEMQATSQPQAPHVQQFQPAAEPPKAASSNLKPTKGGITPALDFLRSLGMELTDGPLSKPGSDTGSDTSKGRKKDKGKAKAVDEAGSALAVAVGQPPDAQPAVVQVSPAQEEVPADKAVDKGEESLPQTSQPASESTAPIVASESHADSAGASELPPPPDRLATPPSPLLAPTIAVLEEPRSPTTTASPLPEPIVDPAPPPVPPPAPRSASVASQRPPAPAEYAPLKRKRDSVPSTEPRESWVAGFARVANRVSDEKRADNARLEQMVAVRSAARASMSGVDHTPASGSGSRATATAKGKDKGRTLFMPETPPRNDKGKTPLFRPETPPNDAQDEDVDVDVVGDTEPIVAAPRSVPPQRQQPTSKGKRRMIMEVVIPLRKGAKAPSKAKAAADLTMDGSESEERENEEEEEEEDEDEPDMRMLRRRLREHRYCARAAVDRYQLDTHLRRKHRGRPDQELRPLARPEECPREEQVLRPSAFPPGVPYFRILGMALSYNVLPAKISAQWHAKNGPKILRRISSTMSPVRTPAPYIPEPSTSMGVSSPGGNLPAFGSPTPVRPRMRLGTVPPDVLGEELEVLEMLAPRSSNNHSPAHSHITKRQTERRRACRCSRSGKSRTRIVKPGSGWKYSRGEFKRAEFGPAGVDVGGCGCGCIWISRFINADGSFNVVGTYAGSAQTGNSPQATHEDDGGAAKQPGTEKADMSDHTHSFTPHSLPMPDKVPAYVSARSADEILSAIRPTKIKAESLRSLNIFLDELLWLVLHSARSLATNRLKAGLLHIMPSALGKDAILEAEVELRTYKMRSSVPVIDEPGVKQVEFPLQPTFELLRQKCEAYCTLGDLEENVAVESELQEKMVNAGQGAPTAEQVAPAALYLTAILEHVCEHVLNNVGQVVARDSSRGTAYSQDVYVALCEDAAVYPLFKTMKVHEHIEAQSRAFRPSHGGSSSISGGGRTRSISRIRPSEDALQARKMSLPTANLEASPASTPPSSFTRRPSADAVLGNGRQSVTRSLSGATLPGSNKSSLERTRTSLERITGKKSSDGHTSGKMSEKSSRGIKLFGKGSGRTSLEDGPSSHMAPFPTLSKEAGPDERSASSLSDGTRRPQVAFQQGSLIESDAGDDSDGPFSQDFDELMRSGATMKVSLTPDRLKTFETFAKKKNQISTRAAPQESASFAVPPLPTLTDMTLSPRISSNRREHDAILEADEGSRSRTQSLAQTQFLDDDPKFPAAPPMPAPPTPQVGRPRSHTESSSRRPSIGAKPGSSNGPSLLRKSSFGGASRDREKSSSDSTPPNEPSRLRKVSEAPKLATLPATPSRRRGPARRQESIDLDDIINEPVTPRRANGLAPKPAHQTANTRDLIDFLSEGPPEPYQPPRSSSSAAIESTVKPAKQGGGRWFRRFVGGSSSASERTPAVPDVPAKTLGKQKSATNIRGASTSSGFSGAGYGKVPPSPALSLDTTLQPQPSLGLVRKVSPNRKAVPAWNPDGPEPASVPHSPHAPTSAMSTPEPPQPKPLLTPQHAESDVFTVSRPRYSDLAPSASPASSKPSSMKRVPVPKLHSEPDAVEVISAPPAEVEVKVPETRPERRRQDSRMEKQEPRVEKDQESRVDRIQDTHPHSVVVPTTEIEKVRRIRTASPIAPPTGVTPDQAAELRAALAHATTADECRMLLDLVLGQWGLGRPAPEPSAVPPLSAGCSEFDDGDEAMAVDMLLGEGSMRLERQWPLTPKDSHSKLHEARVASVRSE